MLKGNAKAGVIARQFLSIRPQADLVQQSLAADGAIAWVSSNLFPLSLNADRAPQLKANVRRPHFFDNLDYAD